MKIVAIYVFLLASGQTLEAERPAVDPAGHKPIRTIQRCEELATEQAIRFREAFAVSSSPMFQDVTIRCERRP